MGLCGKMGLVEGFLRACCSVMSSVVCGLNGVDEGTGLAGRYREVQRWQQGFVIGDESKVVVVRVDLCCALGGGRPICSGVVAHVLLCYTHASHTPEALEVKSMALSSLISTLC